ncbi:acyl-CoA synthetase [Pseudomonas sp. GM17]|uniref:acyl-CoA synthetase n=1 Tax=Pseudomonas sp. GM17 TaxID=1144323 RepID=UPI00027244BF|nr:acyl-CoA synthetase [Pseudomonas sp. GM17]WIE49818.1 acyl-CoA synthetase [Pseudomonas sp. GM17]
MAVSSLTDIESMEKTPLSQRGLAPSTYEAISRTAKRFPNAPALTFFLDAKDFRSTHQWDYSKLMGDINRAANAFHNLGIGPKDVIAFILPNLPETQFTIWGGEASGIVMAVNPLLEPTQMAELLRAANAKVVVTLAPTPGADLWSKLAGQLKNLPGVKHIVWVSMAPYVSAVKGLALRWVAYREKANHQGVKISDLRSLMRGQPSSHLKSGRQIRAQERSSFFCTGGTTGLPKIAARTHGSEVYDAWAMASNMFPREPGDVIFCGLPLFHVNGQMMTGLMPWTYGDHVVMGTPQGYRGNAVISRFWEIVEHFKINYFSGVPTVFSSLLQYPTDGKDLSSLTYALCGAAPMPVEIFREFEQRIGISILEGYGLTEGACVSTCNPPAGERRVGSIGLRLAYQGMRTVVLDDNGAYLRDAEIDEVGVVAIHGPNVFEGYLEPSHNKGLWIDIAGARWLNTGDLGRQDAEGYFWLTGRKKELIIRGGHNIDPKVIEESMQTHPAIALVAAVGCPDAHAGEVPVIYVQLHPGMTASKEELMIFAVGSISERAAVPKRIELLDALPLTPVGKIFKPALQQREIAYIVRQEAATAGLNGLEVEVVQDTRRGLVAQINSMYRATLERALGRYSFAVNWIGDSPQQVRPPKLR